MVDFSICDAETGRLLLGRCGVETWSHDDELPLHLLHPHPVESLPSEPGPVVGVRVHDLVRHDMT